MIEPNFHGTRKIGHGGNCVMYSGDFIFLPEKGIGVVCGTNCGIGGVFQNMEILLLSKLLGQEIPPDPAAEIKQIIPKISGKYYSYQDLAYIEVSVKDGVLNLETHMGTGPSASYPLMLEDIKTLKFIVPLLENQMKIQFQEDPETKEVFVRISRDLYKKK